MGFVPNFIHFPAVQETENRLQFDKVTERLKVETLFETQCIYIYKNVEVSIRRKNNSGN